MKNASDSACGTSSSCRVSRIVQIHPALQCNLSCLHCYSGSAPSFRKQLDIFHLKKVIAELAAMGYNVVSLSGGEPFLYKHLEELLSFSRSLEYFNSITTNAMLLGSERAKRILKLADLVAISVDGKPEQHDHIRNFNNAFQKMLEGVSIVKNEVAHFGFIHTVFPDSWQIMPWITDFAIHHGAKLLHLHPLEITGRASNTLSNIIFDEVSLHKIFIAFHYLKESYANKIFMQLDLLHRDNIIQNPNFTFHQIDEIEFTGIQFADIFKEIIIDEEGDIYPIAYNCSAYFKIGNIYHDIAFEKMAENFLRQKIKDIIQLYNITYQAILEDEENEIFNWSELMINNSHKLYDLEEVA